MSEHKPYSKLTPAADEQAASVRLATELAPRIDKLARRQKTHQNEVRPGSRFAGDDRAAKPYQLSHAAGLAISHAIDNLRAIRIITVRGENPRYEVVTLPYALYPLLRCAYENSSQALWLMGSANRNERLTRRFRLWVTDGANAEKFAKLAGVDPKHMTKANRLKLVTPLAAARGINLADCAKAATNTGFIRGAAQAVGGDPDKAEALWRSLSGLSHADYWASTSTTDKDEVAISADGQTITLKTTASVTNIVTYTGLAVSLTEAAVRKYDYSRARQI